MAVTTEELMTALKDCYDPEIPVNIVDLGLIYDLRVLPPTDGGGQNVEVDMTLTAPGCPSHVSISADVKQRLERVPGVSSATVNVVWTPPWTPDRLSTEAKKKLGIE